MGYFSKDSTRNGNLLPESFELTNPAFNQTHRPTVKRYDKALLAVTTSRNSS